MFRSFFPRPTPFFCLGVYLDASRHCFLAGRRRALVVTPDRHIKRGANQRRALLEPQLSALLRLLRALRLPLRRFLVYLLAPSLAAVVDSRHRADYLRHLVSGGGERRHQRLVSALFLI